MSIVITTPTGNIGSRALQQLLKAGADVSVIVRQPEKLSDSIRSRVKVHQGTLADAALVTRAFQGAKAVLWLTPSNLAHPDVAAYGKPVKHVQITPDQASQAFLGFGASPGFAKALVEMYKALAQPGAVAESRAPQTTTPTTLREWSDAVFRQIQ
jgi:uncharacterized protein YbjT (DUF2867 family)